MEYTPPKPPQDILQCCENIKITLSAKISGKSDTHQGFADIVEGIYDRREIPITGYVAYDNRHTTGAIRFDSENKEFKVHLNNER